ncbi:pilus assembly protein PilM [Alkalimarinus coralli]|uniref:pilus assembly protein PilM n=1 Tax=Alkalimarinus coralli TaxID=2935863 RepID=UPI00202BA495|nr:pilus assembly protein PilM [Alkalimarinus coralli]
MVVKSESWLLQSLSYWGDTILISLFKKKSKVGLVGVEVRSDGISIAQSLPGDGGSASVVFQDFIACKAAQRKDALAGLVDEYGLKGFPCNLVLTSDQYQIFQTDKPPVADEELSEAIRWKVKDLIDYSLDDAITDVFDFPDDATRGRGSLVNVVSARKALLQQNVKLMAEVGLDLQSIDITELVLRNISMRYDAVGSGLALLFMRPGFGMILVSKGDTMYFSRRFDFSLDALRNTATQESTIQQLALEVQRSLDYYESQMGQVPPKELLLVGPDGSFPLANMLGQNVAVSVKNLDVAPLFEDEDISSEVVIQNFAAVGAALRESQL